MDTIQFAEKILTMIDYNDADIKDIRMFCENYVNSRKEEEKDDESRSES